MSVRQATLDLSDLATFLAVWPDTLGQGSAFLPAGSVQGELAPEFKLDVLFPLGVGRVGPIGCQVIFRGPDGTAARIPEPPPSLEQGYARVLGVIEVVRQHLLDIGEVVLPGSEEAAAPPRAVAHPSADDDEVGGAAAPVAEAPRKGRGLMLPDVADLAPSRDGALGDRSLRDALVDIAVKRETGLLTLITPDGLRRFGFWHKGGPVGFRSEPMQKDEVLGVLLYKAEQITKDQLAESLKIMERTGSRQGEALIEMGVLNFAQLVMVLQKQTELILQKVLRLRDGVWAFHTLPSLPERFVNPPLRVPSILFRALVTHAKEMNADSLAAALRTHLDSYVRIRKDCEPVLNEIAFNKAEQKFLEVIRGNSWRLREVFAVSNLSRGTTAATIWALIDLNFIDFGQAEDTARYVRRIAGRILQKAGRSANHFDALEVHWICTTEDVHRAYKKLKEEFDPAQFHDLTEELSEALQKIHKAVEAGYVVLKDDAQRRAYRKEVIEKTMIDASAELLGKKGEMAIMRGERGEAMNCWSKAVELNPLSAEYREGLKRAQGL